MGPVEEKRHGYFTRRAFSDKSVEKEMADSDKFVDEETADSDKSISMKRNQ